MKMGYLKETREMENFLGERIIFPDEIIDKLENNEAQAQESEMRNTSEPFIIKVKKPRENRRKTTIIMAGVAAVILVILAITAIFYAPQGTLTGYTAATREIQQTIDYNEEFNHYTETQLELTNITSFRISGVLDGTRATIKLRINNTEYTVAEITKPQDSLITGMATAEEPPLYTITTDKAEYALGETVTINITPEAAEKSIYITYGEETTKLDGNTYVPAAAGEYTAIALIVLADDILRIETNFTVSEGTTPLTNQTNTTTPETPTETEPTPEPEPAPVNTYEFTSLCTDTCSLAETSNPVLIIELEPNTTLTITELIITKTKENSAPEQTKNLPDIILIAGQTLALDLNDYFNDPDGDTVQYDINEILEINSTITRSTLTISSDNTGAYTAYIYATDGDKLVTSNIFLITITTSETNESINQTTPTEPMINVTLNETTDPCSNPEVNLRPSTCFVGVEELAFEELAIEVQSMQRGRVGLFTRYGNLVIRGLLVQNATGEPSANDFQVGFSERSGFVETRTVSGWISTETGNLHLRGRIYENQDILSPSQFNTFIIRNKHNMILGYFDELTGDLYLRGNIVQLGKV